MMTFRKFLAASAVSASLLLSTAPAAAQSVQAGATITDPQGGEVGTVVRVEGDNLVLRTDRHEVRLPVASFTATDEAVLFAMTRAELNASVDQALAQARQAISVGTMVYDRDGAPIGPVEETDETTITVKLDEQPIRVPRTAVAPAPDGVRIGSSLAELRAQIAAASGGSANSSAN
jgi:hypothetical protein